MLPTSITTLVAVLLVIVESVFLHLFGVLAWAPQMAVLVMVYVALRRNFTSGAVVTLIVAAVADLCWGGPRGYYALGLTATFFAMTLVRLRWHPRRALAVALWTVPAVLITDVVAFSALYFFRRGVTLLSDLLSVSPLAALWTALAALPLAWFFLLIDRVLERRKYEAVTL